MDRGIPTEEILGEMRASDPTVNYLVGAPKGRLTKPEKLHQLLLNQPGLILPEQAPPEIKLPQSTPAP